MPQKFGNLKGKPYLCTVKPKKKGETDMNVFQKAALAEKTFEMYFENNGSGYKRITTFYSDLTIAECVSG